MIGHAVRALPAPLRAAIWRAWHRLRGWPAWTPGATAVAVGAAAAAAPSPSRRDILLAHVDRAGLGLEIGPSHSPVAPRRDGFRVEIVDHADRAHLVEKYCGHGVDVDAIEEVDHVWDGRTYAELTGRPKGYDWIIASHVIEHTPDLVGFVRGCDEVLRDGGVLSLAVPDKRFCFDRMRPPTSLQAVVDAHLERRTNHTPGRVVDHCLNAVALDGRIAWAPGDAAGRALDAFGFVHGPDYARERMRAVLEEDAYVDIHAWVFTPSGFRLLLDDLHALGLVALRELSFTAGATEFFVTLSRAGEGPGLSRLALMQRADAELAAAPIKAANATAGDSDGR